MDIPIRLSPYLRGRTIEEPTQGRTGRAREKSKTRANVIFQAEEGKKKRGRNQGEGGILSEEHGKTFAILKERKDSSCAKGEGEVKGAFQPPFECRVQGKEPAPG